MAGKGYGMKNLKRILLVEDDQKDAELTLAALEECSLANDVFVVRDGEEALDYLYCEGKFKERPKGNPIVVLLDLKLPKVDGLEVLQQVKSEEFLKLIPVIALTSSREEQDIAKSYKLGVNSYVVKPVNFEEFFSAIQELSLFWAILNEPPPGSLKKVQ